MNAEPPLPPYHDGLERNGSSVTGHEASPCVCGHKAKVPYGEKSYCHETLR